MWKALGIFVGRSGAPVGGTPAAIQSSVNPTSLDDVNEGLFVGQPWINLTTGEVFFLVDSTAGAAVWSSTTSGGTAYLAIPWIAQIGPEDFLGSSSGPFGTRTAGSGATISFGNGYAGGDGFISGNPGTAAGTGLAAVGCPITGSLVSKMILGSGLVVFDAIWAIPTLSDPTDTVIHHSGLFSNVFASGAGESPHAVAIRYTDAVNSGKLLFVTALSGVETTADTGITLVAGVLYHVHIEVDAAGANARCYIGVAGALPALVATLSATIPTGLAAPVGPSTYMTRVAGSSNRSFDLDVQYAGKFRLTRR